MIEKMDMVYVVSTVGHKDEMLRGLRDMGLLHIAEKKNADPAAVKKFSDLSKMQSELLAYAPDGKEKGQEKKPVLSDEEFGKLYADASNALAQKNALNSLIGHDRTEIDRLAPWGEFSPEQVRSLRREGIDLHFYRVDRTECGQIFADDQIRAIRMASVEKSDTIAVVGALPAAFHGTELEMPVKGAAQLRGEIEDAQRQLLHCDEVLKNAALYDSSFRSQMVRCQNEVIYSSASKTAENDAQLVWISGYIPADDIQKFEETAKKNHWAYAVGDVSEDDDAIPTKLRYNRITRLISPLYKILGILPGYRETDISLWFLMFFTLFFAMIFGDAGYGCLLLAGTILLIAKAKKLTTPTWLLLVLSIATIFWGAITGTWFGMESAMKVPFLKALVLPGFANYPEYFHVSAAAQQNNIMKFSFSIGAIQMELGSLLSVKRKLGQKDLSFVSDIGWMLTICAMYLLSLYLVLGESVNISIVFGVIACGFILVVLFGAMGPGKSFAQGVREGLGGAFTSFLNTISCFGNVMSYIRLFAVGMAGLAIAQSFNNMAAGLAHGPLFIVAVIVVVLGHLINIVMAFLSVIVHGVRLNVLEFSGQVGLEWTGIAYDPFRKENSIKTN